MWHGEQSQPASWPKLAAEEWLSRRRAHQQLLQPFVEKFRLWRNRGRKHPVYDFLFSYYSFSTGQLLRWSPGVFCRLEVSGPKSLESELSEALLDWPDHFLSDTLGGEPVVVIDALKFPERRSKFLAWAINYLEQTRDRPALFHCFGLHEWAMVYKSTERHHPDTPLRVSDREVAEVLENNPVCCTHYDAYRFFTAAAVPLNRHCLSREQVVEFDQAGCIHANMDLYKFGYKIAPFLCSDLLAELFLLARRAREIDMQASPYDLSEFGVGSIKIECREGRSDYVELQRELSDDGQVLREKLLCAYKSLKQFFDYQVGFKGVGSVDY